MKRSGIFFGLCNHYQLMNRADAILYSNDETYYFLYYREIEKPRFYSKFQSARERDVNDQSGDARRVPSTGRRGESITYSVEYGSRLLGAIRCAVAK